MSTRRQSGPIVIDTDVFSADLVPASRLAERYAPLLAYAQLRADWAAAGHALAQRDHDADRWIAATAIRLAVPPVSNDGIFRRVPGLALESLPAA